MRNFIRGFALLLVFVLVTLKPLFSQCSSPHNTPMLANNGQNGIMFDITAITDVTIDSVWSNWDPGTLPSVEIWSKTGTCVGSQATPGAWTLVGSVTNLLSAGNNNLTQIPIYINLFVPAGQTIALYVTKGTTAGAVNANYTTGPFGTTAGQLYNQNANIQVSYAYGKSYPFAATFNPRIFNGRIFYSCCPTPPPIQGPINGLTSVCIGDTITYWVPQDSLAVTYNWQIPSSDSIVSGATDSLMQIVIGPTSTGGQICVNYSDTCTNSNDTCLIYTITQPSPPLQPSGIPIICTNDSAYYSIPAVAGAVSYNWFVSNGSIIQSNIDSTSVLVKFLNTGITQVCAQVTDNCATSDTVCFPVNASGGTTPSNAGLDIYNCDSEVPTLNANNPANGIGTWSVINAPAGGAGSFADSSINTTTYSGGSPGVHTLAWTITNGTCPTTIDQVEVHIAGTPAAAFSFDNACDGSAVNFIDQTIANGTNISSWAWDFTNDGNANTLAQNASFAYSTPGFKLVQLIVTSLGCSDTVTNIVQVYPRPVLNIIGLNACDESAIIYNNSSSILSGSIDSMSWEYGDGSVGFGTGNNSYVFPTAGNYSTTVSAYSDYGCQSEIVVPVEVYSNPQAEFEFVTACQYQELSFQNRSTVSGANITSYAWNMGNGSTYSLENPVHTFNTNGLQNVNLLVTTNEGCVNDTTIEFEVYPTPASEYNYSNKVCRGQATLLEEVSTISYGDIVSFEWFVHADSLYFGGDKLSYSFPKEGIYKVSLTSISDEGCKHTIEKNIPVFATPSADFTIANACEGDLIPAQNLSLSTEPVANYFWNFNDGSELLSDFNPSHSYDTFGVFEVVLKVETFKGCVSEKSNVIEIYERPKANYELSIDSGCSPMVLTFLDSTKMLSNDNFSFIWRAGENPFIRSLKDTIYNYSGTDQFLPIEAIYTSANGCVAEFFSDSSLQLRPQPRAKFSYLPTEISTKDPLVHFKDESRDANYWGWIFGDGTTDKERNPTKLYAEAGEYQVLFWTRNIFNCTDTASAILKVEPGNRLFVPNSFSPNQDLLNDEFKIYGLETATEAILRVYDRWGNLVWKGDILNSSWNGKNPKGKLVASGVYLINLRYSINDKVFEFNNSLTVLGAE